MKKLMLATALLITTPCVAEMFIIVHPSNMETQAEDVRRIYLGEVNFINHGRAQVYEQKNSLQISKDLKANVLKISSSQYRSMWARSIFTGRNLPPKQMKNDQLMIAQISKNPHGIGYVHVDSLDPQTKEVRIVQRISAP